MPSRMSGFCSTSTVKRFSAPAILSSCVAVAEKPHWGNCGEPFMYRTTGWPSTCDLMVSCTLMGFSWQSSNGTAGHARDAGEVLDRDQRTEAGRLQQPSYRLRLVVSMFK